MPSRHFVYGLVGVLVGAVLAAAPRTAAAQEQVTVTGVVEMADVGAPLAGATISLVGDSSVTTTTDELGNFSLQVPAGSSIEASIIGFRSQTLAVGEGDLKFELSPSAEAEVIVIVGSRTERSALDTPVPVDVLSLEAVDDSGYTETNQVIAQLAPSYNASHQTISDGSDHINPASLRGLGPDQLLVLVNGQRRHQSSLVHVNGTFGRGSVGVDLNAIPKAAIKRIEILRDGASAMYGSDAIAGVINIVLKDARETLEANVSTGITGEGDGEQIKTSAAYGIPIGERGVVRVTAEYLHRGRTNRSDPWSGNIFPGISGEDETNAELELRGKTREDYSIKTGQSQADAVTVFVNTSLPFAETGELYSTLGFTRRKGHATGFFRRPDSEARVNLDIYPDGFLPEINPTSTDLSATAGVRGKPGGWAIDGNVGYGQNTFQYQIENSMNASLETATNIADAQTSFDAGTLTNSQATVNLDVQKPLPLGAFDSIAFVTGAELRYENYKIDAGEDSSWALGTVTTEAGALKAPGAQVFPGFQPSNELDEGRTSFGGYLGIESRINEDWVLDLVGRFENYSDFGSAVNGKFATHYTLPGNLGIRGAVSTGFRAPSLGQAWFNNVSTQFVDDGTGNLVAKDVMTSNNADEVTRAFGMDDLKEETSLNVSGGLTYRPLEGMSITADYYRITIDDRIVLTSRFTDADPIVADILSPFPSVSQAQFFANAVDTETNGMDLVVNYGMGFGKGNLDISASANVTRTVVTDRHIPQGVADRFAGGDLGAVQEIFFNREEENRLETALPKQRGTLAFKYSQGRFGSLFRASYYGSVKYLPTNPDLDETFGARVLLDLDLGYQLESGLRLSLGATNLLNTYPDKHGKAGNYSSGRFPYSRRVTQFGQNGGFYYLRMGFTM